MAASTPLDDVIDRMPPPLAGVVRAVSMMVLTDLERAAIESLLRELDASDPEHTGGFDGALRD